MILEMSLYNSEKGFTLIELLVVISIISLLASIVTSSLQTVRQDGRQASRIASMTELRKALVIYGNENDDHDYNGNSAIQLIDDTNSLFTLLNGEGLIPNTPVDPVAGRNNATDDPSYSFYYCNRANGTNSQDINGDTICNGGDGDARTFALVFHNEDATPQRFCITSTSFYEGVGANQLCTEG